MLALFLFISTNILCAFVTEQFRRIGIIAFLCITCITLLVWVCNAVFGKSATKHFGNLFLCMLFCLSSFCLSYSFFDKTLTELENQTDEAEIVAEIDKCLYSADYSTVYTAKIESINGTSGGFSAELTYPGACELQSGNRIQTSVLFNAFAEDVYGYDERNSSIASGILVAGEFTEYTVLEDTAPSIGLLFKELRTSIAKRIDSSSKMRTSAPLIKALLLGDTDDLGSSLKQDFRRLGISHILSISGTHFTTLLGMIALLLTLLGINKRVIYILLIPIAVFYMGLTGFSVTVCRAGIMSILSYWGFLCGRMRDSYTALFLSVTLILICSPNAVLSIGLWLSFAATFTILILMEIFSSGKMFAQRKSLPGNILFFLVSHLAITVAISFTTLPITAACFGEISIISPLSNLLLVPLFELYLYIAPFAVIFAAFDPFTILIEFLSDTILSLTQSICDLDNLLISVRQNFVFILAIIGCACTLLLVALPLRRRGFVLLPGVTSILGIALGLCIFFHLHSAQTSITYFTAGASDGIVITDRNNTLCIDISNGGSSAAYKAEYVAAENYCPEISGYMFTHYRVRHINQFYRLTNRTNVHKLYLPRSDAPADTNVIASLCEIAEAQNIEIVWFSYGEPVMFEECAVTLFPLQDISRSTHDVICLKITTKNTDTLYLGSSYSETKIDLNGEIADAEYIFFGQHAPIAKKPFEALTTAVQIYGSAHLADLSLQNSPKVILGEDDQYTILLK